MGRTQGMALGLLFTAILLGAGLGSFSDREVPTGSAAPTTDTGPPSPDRFPVYVSGWVATPGVVDMAEGAIVADSVAAAGGAMEGALLDSVNLARPLVAGDHVQIPGPGDSVPVMSPGESDGIVSINQADVSALEELPGVGPVLAARIVDHREANGPFETVEDLLEVPGIGEAKLASMRDLIRVP